MRPDLTDSGQPGNLLTMLSVLPRGVDLVVGERSNRRSVYNFRRANCLTCFNLLPLILFGVTTRDAGSIKLGRKELFILPLRSRSPFVEAERIIVARRNGYRIAFVPIEFAARSGGEALGATFPDLVASLRDCLKLAVTRERYPSRRAFLAPQCPKHDPYWMPPSATAYLAEHTDSIFPDISGLGVETSSMCHFG